MFSDKRRGDIWWMSDTHRKPADTCLIRGDRPVIVVSSDSANQTGSTATDSATTSFFWATVSRAWPCRGRYTAQTEPICSSTSAT